MTGPAEEHVDEHRVALAAAPGAAWPVLLGWVDDLCGSSHGVVGPLLGTRPRSGFEVSSTTVPEEVVLVGRHRFSRYSLVLRLSAVGAGSELSAVTYADFPGPHGRLYRTLVIGTGLHVVATRRMLGQVAARVERLSPR